MLLEKLILLDYDWLTSHRQITKQSVEGDLFTNFFTRFIYPCLFLVSVNYIELYYSCVNYIIVELYSYVQNKYNVNSALLEMKSLRVFF